MKFGTDGVRGRAGTDLGADFALALGRAAGALLVPGGAPLAFIGGDTRESTPMFAAALTAGLLGAGVDVVDLGVATTPEVAFRAATADAIGAVISASHNPFHDNGIKLFARGGRKLRDDVQRAIEQHIAAPPAAESARFGRMLRAEDVPVAPGSPTYREHLLGVLDGRQLRWSDVHGDRPLSVVVDTANGAASGAAEVFAAAGAEVFAIADEPDGRNINEGCGATYPGPLAAAVTRRSADVGIALDGDADRLIAVDHDGRIVDGDHIIAICADDLRTQGRLKHDTVVVTVMTNLGFRLAMRERGIEVVETGVGDRYVLEALATGGYSLGGEQSGHIVFADHATTGDGVLTALVLLDVVVRAGRPLAEIAAGTMTSLPQVLVNVRVSGDASSLVDGAATVIADVEHATRRRWPRAGASVRHRATRPRDGRSAHRRGRTARCGHDRRRDHPRRHDHRPCRRRRH